MKVLVTGAAGYVGSVLTGLLLENGYQVVGLDNLMFGGQGLLRHFRNENFEFVKGDVRNESTVREAAKECDVVIHLAAIVGYPACRDNPKLATDVNLNGTVSVLGAAMDYGQRSVIFASTQSVYGKVEDTATEDTPTNPLSLYAETKEIGEDRVLCESPGVVLRFPTAFGLSPRMRLDLLVNDFVYKAITDCYLVVYQPHFMRSFLHVYDLARAYLFTLQHLSEMTGQIYNVGSDQLNFTKRQLCETIQQETKCAVFYEDFDQDLDKRNYSISCEKIARLGYEATISLEDGVKELVRGIPVLSTRGYANA